MHRDHYKKNGELEKYLDEAQEAYNEQRVLAAQRSLQCGGEQLLKHQMRMYSNEQQEPKIHKQVQEIWYMAMIARQSAFSFGLIFMLRKLKLASVS